MSIDANSRQKDKATAKAQIEKAQATTGRPRVFESTDDSELFRTTVKMPKTVWNNFKSIAEHQHVSTSYLFCEFAKKYVEDNKNIILDSLKGK